VTENGGLFPIRVGLILMFNFQILAKDKNSRARVGIIETSHGIVETPAYVIVGTNAAVRTLKAEDLPVTKTQIIIANTYHLWRELGDKIDSFEGLHQRTGFNGVIMTDSGGFQVFSLGFAREHGTGKIAGVLPQNADKRTPFGSAVRSFLRRVPAVLLPRYFSSSKDITDPLRLRRSPQDKMLTGAAGGQNLVRISDDGVKFDDGGRELFLNPEISISIQEKLGADIIFAFDECTSPLNDYEYNKIALVRTHAWAKRCLAAQRRNDQALYGIVQGGHWRDLREESARFIGSLPFLGFGIGGSFGQGEMRDVLQWTLPLLPEEKPRHLLGVGRIEDILNAVELGVDTLDCVIPTREARHGSIWTAEGRYDVKKGKYAGDKKPLAKNCACPVCSAGRTRGEIKALFQAGDHDAGRLATMHNVWFFNDLMRQIRESIKEGRFQKFKKQILANLKR
jgi:queuine tRNA-ribosyltransferase/7-cyano-7-deazaguanine tRNA-ribosyltransferase